MASYRDIGTMSSRELRQLAVNERRNIKKRIDRMKRNQITSVAAKNFMNKGGLDSIRNLTDKQIIRRLADFKVFNEQLGSTVSGARYIRDEKIKKSAIYRELVDGRNINLTEEFQKTIKDIKVIMDACERDEYLWIELRDRYIDAFDNGKIMTAKELIREANKILKEHGKEPIKNINDTSATRRGSTSSSNFTRRKK